MKIGVIGSGSIGPDLAYGFVSALARVPDAKVFLVDINPDALKAGVERIRGYAKKGLSRGKLSPKAVAAMEAALTPTDKIADLAECSYVLEAASENLDVKKKILADLESHVDKSCLIGFATSGLPRKQIAASAKHPERCFVNHPFFPAWRALPIEVVSPEPGPLHTKMMSLLKRLGKVPIMTADVECFAADDIFCNYISEAARIVADKVATPAQIDRIVDDAIGGGGPFAVMDLTRGNLLTVHCQELMKNAPTGTEWFSPPKILSEQGDTLWHDRKKPSDPSYDDATKKAVLDRILAVLLARTYFVTDGKICAPLELNWMTRMALGFRKGLLEVANDLGADKVSDLCRAYAEKNPGFEIPKSIREKTIGPHPAYVQLSRVDNVGVVTIFRPEVKGALSAKAIAEVDACMKKLTEESSIVGIVFTSYDGGLAGADIGELAALPNPEACKAICMASHKVFARIEDSEKPIVAAVNGPVLGGGAEISMACHARVVGKQLILGQPEVNLGIIPGYGGSQRLPRLIGPERANQMLRDATTLNAEQACELGWGHKRPVADPLASAIELVKAVASGKEKLQRINPAPVVFTAPVAQIDIGHRSKRIDEILARVINQGWKKELKEGLLEEAQGFADCKDTVDMDIGMKNFVQNGPRVPASFLHE